MSTGQSDVVENDGRQAVVRLAYVNSAVTKL